MPLSGCRRSEAEYQKLLVENEHLKAQLASLSAAASGTGQGSSQPGEPDLKLEIDELWAQRFDDNDYRAKQRLLKKTLRVTGLVENVTDSSITIYGRNKQFGSVRMNVNLDAAHALRIRNGLATLEKGVTITAQGNFLYDRMWLDNAFLVDKDSGKPLTTDDLGMISQARGTDSAPPKTAPEK